MSVCVLKPTKMDNYIIFFFFAVNIVNAVTATKSLSEGYCWRDFKGFIPKDAFKAGTDKDGNAMYIGQVLDDDRLIPGKIYENDPNIYFEFGEQPWSTNETIKIFCTKHPEYLEWVPTSKWGVHDLRKNKIVIKGGFQSKFLTFIGRTQLPGKTDIGKIICRTTDCLALYTNEDGDDVEYHRFDILTYNPDNANIVK